MSNDIFNIRFGYRHLHIGFWFIQITVNPYWIRNKPKSYFQIM